jgi:hypothetical protein
MALYRIENDTPIAWTGEPINGFKYPKGIEATWSAEELERVGLYRPRNADDIPLGYRSIGKSLKIVDGVPKFVNVLDAIIITPIEVKAEAARRILARFPDWKQRNMNAQAIALLQSLILNGSLTAEEQALSDSLNAAWAAVSAIRAASDAIEAMDPIPLDYADDTLWP